MEPTFCRRGGGCQVAGGRVLLTQVLVQFDALNLVHRLAKKNGLTVAIVSHDLPMVARYCDRILMIHDHKIHAIGTPEEVLTPENMKTVFNVDAELQKDPKTGRNTVLLHDSYTSSEYEN